MAYRGRVRPRKRYVYQVLQQRRRGTFRTVGTKRLQVRSDGTFRGSFVPAAAAAYRFYVVARPDSATARGASRVVQVAVLRRSGSGGASTP